MASHSIILVVSVVGLISMGMSARINIEDMDYNSLASLLSDYDGNGGADEMKPIINTIGSRDTVQQNIVHTETSTGEEQRLGGSGSTSASFSFEKPSISTLLAPQVEVLNLIEAFLKLKAEMTTRIHLLINDNFDLFKSLYNVIIGKVSKLHSFTLLGISVIRKIIEFAVQLMGAWEINKPSISFGFNKYHNIA